MRVALLLGLFGLLAGCQSTPPRYLPPNGVPAQLALRVAAPFDDVWRAIVETFAASTTSIETIEKASGFIAAAQPIDFAGVADLGEWVEFGTINGVLASSHVQARPSECSARVRYNVLVVHGDTQQEVRVNTGWSGHIDVSGIAPGGAPTVHRVPLTGHSTGYFETRLLELIAGKLPGAKVERLVTQPFVASKYESEPRKYGQASEDDGWVKHGN